MINNNNTTSTTTTTNNNNNTSTVEQQGPVRNPFHKKDTLFPTPTGHHHQKKERAFLPDQGTTGVASDLNKSVEVYSAQGDMLYTIPIQDIVAFPEGVKPNEISSANKVHLCPYFNTSNLESSCPHGSECKHIHASLKNAVAHDIHTNYAWKNLSDVKYERFPAGSMFQVAPPNETLVLDVIPSNLIIKTKAFDGHNNNNNGKRVISHCAHYYYNRTCNRGTRCCFVHAISFTSTAPSNKHNNNNNANVEVVPEEHRKSYGRTQPIREFPSLAAAQQAVRDKEEERNNNNNASKNKNTLNNNNKTKTAVAVGTSTTTSSSKVTSASTTAKQSVCVTPVPAPLSPPVPRTLAASISTTPAASSSPVATSISANTNAKKSKFLEAFTSSSSSSPCNNKFVFPPVVSAVTSQASNAPSTPPNTMSGSDVEDEEEQKFSTSAIVTPAKNITVEEEDLHHHPAVMMMKAEQEQQVPLSPSTSVRIVKIKQVRRVHNPYSWTQTTSLIKA